MDISLVYITARDKEEAVMIGKTLVAEKLVACVNIIDNMTSIYRWQGKICESNETVIICKTSSKLIESVSKKVNSIHSYDCPCIAAIPISGGNPEFLRWVESASRC